MEGQLPTPDQSRTDEKKDGVPSISISEGMEADVGGVMEKNYVIKLLNANIWSMILDYLTDPKDITSLMEAVPVLRSDNLLEKRRASAQLLLMLPILMEKCRLAPSEIINLRLLNKQTKAKLDKQLVHFSPPWFRTAASQIRRRNEIQAILDRPEGFTGCPFIARYCFIPGYYLPNKLEILRRYGPELQHGEIEVCSSEVDDTMVEVKQLLPYLTNVKELTVTFVATGVLDIEDWNEYEADGEFPAFNSLTTLHLTRYSMRDSSVMVPTASYVRPILLAYGNQLTNLFCDAFVFGGHSVGFPSFDNLRRLEVSFFNQEESVRLGQIFRNLAIISCPQLASLSLSGDMMRITAKTFSALNNFANSLKELHLGNFKGDPRVFHAVDPGELREFPQLTRLTLHAADAGTGWRHLFRNMFTKLEEVRFELPGRARAIGKPGIPMRKVREGYFTLFPNLKRIVCVVNGPDLFNNDEREIVFLRKSMYETLTSSSY